MTKAEVVKKVGSLSLQNFTIAGAQSTYPTVPAPFEFFDGRLDNFAFYFDPKDFENVQGAVKQKYPALDCERSTVTNAMGAAFNQVECHLRDKTGWLTLSRFAFHLDTSVLRLTSDRYYKKNADKQKTNRKDL